MTKTGILIILIFIARIGLAQEDSAVDKWKIKAGYSRYIVSKENNFANRNNYRLEGNFSINKHISTGLYLGYSKLWLSPTQIGSSSIESDTPFYGLVANFHLLPFFLDDKGLRPDLYLRGEIGGHYYIAPDGYRPRGHETDYALGAGFLYSIWRHLGVYAEYTFGSNTDFRFGLSYKF